MEQLDCFEHGLHSQFFVENILTAMELSQGITAAPKGKIGSNQVAMRGLLALLQRH